MSLSWNRRMTAFCSSSVAVHSCSSSSSCSAVSSSVSIALVPSRSATVRGQVAMPYEDSQERTSPPSLSHRTAHLSKMGVRPARSVHNHASAGSGGLLCEGLDELAAVMIAQPLPKLLAGELAVRLGHGALAVRPAGLDRVQPRALARQAADEEAATAPDGL